MKFGEPMPDEYLRWLIVRETGWTLEQVDSLSIKDLHEFLQVRDVMAKAGK